MANVSRIRGARPVFTLSGADWGAHVRKYAHSASDGTALFVGDFVTLDTAHTVTTGTIGNGLACVKSAAAGDALLGVVVGVEVDRTVAATEHPGYCPASTQAMVLVAVGQDVVYEMEEDNVGNDLALTDIGSVGNHVASAGSTTTGQSGFTLDSSDVRANTSGHGLLLVGILQKVNNAVGTSAKWLVRINRSAFKLGL